MRSLLTGIALAFLCTAAWADVTIAKWSVSSKPDSDGDCTATREYNDAQDGGASKAIVLFVVGKTDDLRAVIVSLGYQGWKSSKGTMQADLRVDGDVVASAATWQVDGTTAASSFSEAVKVARALSAGRVLSLSVGAGKEIAFDIGGAGQALGAVQYCQQRD